ncbi:ATP-binding protein [uncultured Brevibacillus sp.]|uniref:ATP-binding protein n=1 Tax=uncultured Brevibacillus sp. TaxID=169970 RepID=UPI002592DF62|nr:ATP-binding protein [uncultured Brevibacillus sp.]
MGKKISAVFMTTYHMFQRFREVIKVEDYEYEKRLLKVLYGCDVLLLDDVGGEVPYDSRAERLLDVINARSQKRPIIYSSNSRQTDWNSGWESRGLGSRIASWKTPLRLPWMVTVIGG